MLRQESAVHESVMHTAVHQKARALIVETWQSQANLSLFLILLAVTVFVLPALQLKPHRAVFWADVVYSFVLASGVAIGWGRRRLFVLGVCAAVPALLTRWVLWWSSSNALILWSEVFSLVAILVLAYVVLAQVFRDGPINMMRVQGAVAAYLLLGLAYACAFQLEWRFNPAAFHSSEGQMKTFVDWIYFSLCTLTTLGYGDIVPTTRISRSLATGEAITGQLFLAITIARLVALQASGTAGGNRDGANR